MSERTHKKMPKIGTGVVGLENNRFFCYMNACLQCLIPIDELRNHFIMQEYLEAAKTGQKRMKNNFEFSAKFHDFYDTVYGKSQSHRRFVVRPPF